MPKKKVTPVNKKKKTTRSQANTPSSSLLLPRVSGILKSPWGLAVIIAVAVIGIWAVLSSSAATTTAVCGATVPNYNYQVPFSKAVWNQPICNLPRHPQSADYANRLYKWGNANDGTATALFGKIGAKIDYPDMNAINPYANLWTREVYYASKATTETQIATVSYYSNLDKAGDATFTPNAKIPWNPSWETGQAGDNEIVILDDRVGPTQGRIYFLAGYYTSNPRFPYRKIPPIGCYIAWEQNRICTYETQVGRDLQGNYIDYRTYEGPIGDRGVGISAAATLVLPEEVEAGEIRHALGIAIPNTAYGPVCQKSQLGDWNQEGKTCGTAVMPASKFEWGSATTPPMMNDALMKIYTLDKTIPEGMRFGLDMTYDQIDKWIQSRPDLASNPRRAKTARILAVAMKDYGLLVADTSGAGIGIQMAGAVNPDNAKRWTELGLGPNDSGNLLDGLVTSTNLYVVDPPIGTCADGTKSKYVCNWVSAQYPAVGSPSPSPTQTASPTSIGSPSPSTSDVGTPGSKTTPAPTSDPASKTSPAPTTTAPPAVDKIPPSAPTGITRELKIDPTRVAYNLEVKWRASTDTGGSGIKDYVITRNDGKTWTSVSPILIDNTIVANTFYSYEIKARDNAGNTSAAATTSAKGACLLIWCWLE